MKSVKVLGSQLAHGDVSGLKERTKKLGHKAAINAAAVGRNMMRTALQGEVDDRLKDAHDRLSDVHSTYNDLYAGLKHQAERGKKTAKTLRDSSGPMSNLASGLGQEARRGVQAAMAADVAIAAKWEQYANNLEQELLAPAKTECTAIFTEGDALWAQYIATVNELAAKQGKERLLGSQASTDYASLSERKAAHENTKLPRLIALAGGAEAAMSFLVERHRLLQTALFRDALQAAVAASGSSGAEGAEDLNAILVATRAGWSKLQDASGSRAFVSASNASMVAALPPSRGVFDVPLEVLALRSDAVGGVPHVAHLMIHRLLTGTSEAGKLLIDAEGIFRVAGEPDEMESLRRQLDGGAAAAQAAVRACKDPHVLATTLKQWLRRLPAPLIPSGSYRRIVALGQQGGDLRDGLSALMQSMPQPNLLTLHALFELLEMVTHHAASNRMSASNLSLVFAPTLCRSDAPAATAEGAGVELAVEIPAAATAIASLISRRAECFPYIESMAVSADAGYRMSGVDMARVSTIGSSHAESGSGCYESADVTDAAPSAASAGAAPDSGAATWWYSAGGAQVGPVTAGKLAAMLASGEVSLSTWVFESGTADWQELSQAKARLPAISQI